MGDEFGEAAGAGLGNITWWRLVRGRRHSIYTTLAHTGIVLRRNPLRERRSEFTVSSQSQSSAPSDSTARSTPPQAEKSRGAGLTHRGVGGAASASWGTGTGGAPGLVVKIDEQAGHERRLLFCRPARWLLATMIADR